MANYENIRPYAELVHEAAMNGGVDNYLSQIKESSFLRGVLEEQATEPGKIALAIMVTITVWEGGKFVVRHVRHMIDDRKNKKTNLQKKSEEAEVAIKKLTGLVPEA